MTLAATYWNVVQEPLNAGDTFTVDYTFQNTGTTVEGAQFASVRLSTNSIISSLDEPIGSIFVGSLLPGQTASGSRTFTLPDASSSFWDGDTDGEFTIGVLDDNPGSAEFDDYDKLRINDGDADLVGTYFNVVQEPRNAGDTVDVTFTITNDGTSDATAFDVDFRLSTNDIISTFDEQLGSARIYGLGAGESTTLARTFTLPGSADAFWDTDPDSDFAIGMIVDSDREVLESDEGNNRNEGLFDDYDTLDINDGGADLTGTYFNVVQEPLSEGDRFDVTFTIANEGTSRSSSFDVDFRLSTNDIITTLDEDIGSVIVKPIDAGSSITLTRSFTLPPASDPFWSSYNPDDRFAVGMIVDENDDVIELSEGNNSNGGEWDDFDSFVLV